MTDLDHFFEQAIATGDVPRDWQGRPMLVPRGAPRGHRVPYNRASGLVDRVEDKSFLQKWQMRYLAIALSQPENDDLRALLAGETYQTHTQVPMGDTEKKASAHRIDEHIARALDRQGIHRKADRGSAIHSFCEPGNDTTPPPEIAGDIFGFKKAVAAAGMKEVATELFFAADEVMTAGRGDGLYLCPDGWVRLGDRKTGKKDPGFMVQLAVYSHGDVYDTQTDERMTIHDWVEANVPEAEGYDAGDGLVFDIKPEGTKIYGIDLDEGWNVAKMIHHIDTHLVDDVFTLLHDIPKPDPILTRIGHATTLEELKTIWSRAGSDWTDVHTAAAKARRTEITP